MSRWHSYLNSSIKIIEEYDGLIPLSAWLKTFFRQNRQMGSKDRKIVAKTVYNFYRMGHSSKELTMNERILTAQFICSTSFNELLAFFKPEWNAEIHLSLAEKLRKLPAASRANLVFPWQDALSDGINAERFNLSFLQQPGLFLRIRPGKENTVTNKLAAAGIQFKMITANCISLPNSTNVNTILELDKEAVVQDYNSQRAGSFVKPGSSQTAPINFWDCCAASGGKSIMAYDCNPRIQLSVSDVRSSILHNLRQRFKHAGIKHYQTLLIDLAQPGVAIKKGPFDIILADLPCTGSGTWARTPEQLYFFEPAKIEYYNSLQKKILTNVIPQLTKGGTLVYITCSVFKKENEDIVEFIKGSFCLKFKEIRMLTGYDIRADSMFVAVFEC